MIIIPGWGWKQERRLETRNKELHYPPIRGDDLFQIIHLQATIHWIADCPTKKMTRPSACHWTLSMPGVVKASGRALASAGFASGASGPCLYSKAKSWINYLTVFGGYPIFKLFKPTIPLYTHLIQRTRVATTTISCRRVQINCQTSQNWPRPPYHSIPAPIPCRLNPPHPSKLPCLSMEKWPWSTGTWGFAMNFLIQTHIRWSETYRNHIHHIPLGSGGPKFWSKHRPASGTQAWPVALARLQLLLGAGPSTQRRAPAMDNPLLIWGFPSMGYLQNGWCLMGNPIKMDDLGVRPFMETPVWSLRSSTPSSYTLKITVPWTAALRTNGISGGFMLPVPTKAPRNTRTNSRDQPAG